MICKHHGQLNKDEIRTYVRNRRGRSEITTQCKICHRASASTARNENREKANSWAKEDRRKNPEKYREQAKKYKKKNWQKISVAESLRTLAITNDQYNEFKFEQNNKCSICKEEETRKGRGGEICRLCIDHCHKTGKVRALLCHSCNTGIGKFKDDIVLLQKAIEYLKKHNHVE